MSSPTPTYSFYEYVDITRQAIERNEFPNWRIGQTYFNLLHRINPKVANKVRGSALDPFHRGPSAEFLQFVKENW